MSRAFVKEDVDPPERSRRARGASGLPPGAANYMTARGAKRLQKKIDELRKGLRANEASVGQIEGILASVTIVEAPEDRQQIAFGAQVTVRKADGESQAYQIVGVDELDLHADAVSWISLFGKALLTAEVGDRLTLSSGDRVDVVGVEYPDE
jgi:transcription elongation GreA/GreB family factor